MVLHFCLLLNTVVFLLVNCNIFDDPPPPRRRRPPPPPPPLVIRQPSSSRSHKKKHKSEKKKKRSTLPKTTDPKMKPRECNDNETVDETPSNWGELDAEFTKSPHKKH